MNRSIRELFPITANYTLFFRVEHSLTKMMRKIESTIRNAKLKAQCPYWEQLGQNKNFSQKISHNQAEIFRLLNKCYSLSNIMSTYVRTYLKAWISKCFHPLSCKFTKEGKGKVFLYGVAPRSMRLFHIFRVYSAKLAIKLKLLQNFSTAGK